MKVQDKQNGSSGLAQKTSWLHVWQPIIFTEI